MNNAFIPRDLIMNNPEISMDYPITIRAESVFSWVPKFMGL